MRNFIYKINKSLVAFAQSMHFYFTFVVYQNAMFYCPDIVFCRTMWGEVDCEPRQVHDRASRRKYIFRCNITPSYYEEAQRGNFQLTVINSSSMIKQDVSLSLSNGTPIARDKFRLYYPMYLINLWQVYEKKIVDDITIKIKEDVYKRKCDIKDKFFNFRVSSWLI